MSSVSGVMAGKEEQLYAKVTPRRQRQNRAGTLKHGSCLDVLLSMGFPKSRALKALVSTGGRNVQAACDWLFSHVDDPFLDDPLPREFVLYLRPSGPLLHQLSQFWQQSRVMCGKNKAHNIFPHITLCQFFMCTDAKAEALCEALQTVVGQWRGRFPSPLPLELYISSNFIGLFVEEKVAEVLKSFAADFAAEATAKADVHVEPHKKQLHVTLAYHFPTNHLTSLEKLAKGVDVSLGCDWLAVLFSRDIRFANHETLRVMYPYTPQNEDELELVPGDFIFMSPVEQGSASEGWVYGTSMSTGLSGLLPENYVNRADECDTWVLHGSHSFLNCTSPTVSTGAVGGPFFDGQLDGRLLDDHSSVEQNPMSVVCHPMQVLRTDSQSRLPKRTLFVCRHGERMDVVFGKHWITQCFDAKGRYIRSNLNMPTSLPVRSGGYREYDKDCSVTVFGATQARLVGEALLESHTVIDFVYCSPSLRCVQTAHNILRGLQQDGKTKIRVEPGLFEWTKWVSGSSLPAWIPPTELAAANFSVDTTYRPHIPISKLIVSESYDSYITRSFQVTREILTECKALGNTVLIVAHASSLEACTRQMQGLSPQNSKDFVQVVRKIPYLGFCACEEMGETGMWQLVDPPILPLTHGPNHSFNWRETLLQD
ncbi:ubiquitin-associated and SH3 domain-containing protein B [Neoarius graeffei]|uniref:ubiquitin-associated and SH3 domain-containing protein B n=1 Tax=Neoarius graeffei TaxID=443677 RepID=UPI00298C0FE5|nr:ubiquitin-associated and SH3 domain-containing protein B [Neoarius graeffei]